MPKLYYGKAVTMMVRTSPLVLANLTINGLFGLAVSFYYIALFSLCTLTKNLPIISAVIFFGGLGSTPFLYQLVKQYSLYLIKSAHIAVIAEILRNGKLPDGVSQLEWGKNQVQRFFKQTSIMSAVDVALRATVISITNTMEGIINIIPIPGIEQASHLVSVVVRQATDYIDEAIMARQFINSEENPWKNARDGSILYAQAWKPILTNAAGLALFSWASFAIFLILMIPVGLVLAALLPVSMNWVACVIVLMLAYLLKISIGDLFATVTTLIAFHEETKHLSVSMEIDAKLTEMSEHFRVMKNKAQSYVHEKYEQGKTHFGFQQKKAATS